MSMIPIEFIIRNPEFKKAFLNKETFDKLT